MPLATNTANIYIIGPQSTGKTTLVNALRSESENWLADTAIDKPQIVSEVARAVLTKHGFTAEDIKSSPKRCLALQQLILEAQVSAEQEALQRSSWFISDRSGFDALVYARKYISADAVLEMQRQPAWIEVKARMLLIGHSLRSGHTLVDGRWGAVDARQRGGMDTAISRVLQTAG